MQTTFILKDLSSQFYDGFGPIEGFNSKSNKDKFKSLNKMVSDKSVTRKDGDGSFRDRVEVNQIVKNSTFEDVSFKLENRRGYKLATFEFN